MVLLDTNVLSEVLRPLPDPAVAEWMRRLPREQAWTCSIVVAELLTGVELLPVGRKRAALEHAVQDILNRDFNGQVLDFDLECAHHFARIRAQRRTMGRPIPDLDAQIAAIASVHNATLATRNIRDFELCGVKLVDPWEPM